VSDPITSKRQAALEELERRLVFIEKAKGYSSDAGKKIYQGEAIKWGPHDPPAAIVLRYGVDAPTIQGSVVTSRTPIEIWAIVPADIDRPYLAIEGIIADIKQAVEIEGRDQNAEPPINGRADIDRSLDGITLPKGFERGPTTTLPREPGSSYVGSYIEYAATFEEGWGQP